MIIEQKPLVLKANGFSNGLNRYQLFSYFTLLIQTVLFSCFIVPNFIRAAQISLSILYYISLIILAVCGCKATITDPTDELVYMERRLKLEGKPVDESIHPFQCTSCETSVNQNSKHCRACDRCVTDFDHHCIWINNCVSKKNYNEFLIATICLTLATSVFAIAGVLFVIDFYTKSLGLVMNDTVEKGNMEDQWTAILMAIFSVIAGLVALMCTRLILFHMYLIRHKLTTYEYIVQQREKAENKTKISQEMKLSKVAPLWIDRNKTPENDEENTPAKSDGIGKGNKRLEYGERSERQSTERAILPETHITLNSGINTRRGSKNMENKINSIDYTTQRKDLGADSLRGSDDEMSGKKWRFRVFQQRPSPPKYSNLKSPTNLEYVTSAELGRNTPFSVDDKIESPGEEYANGNYDSKSSTPIPNDDDYEKDGPEKIKITNDS